MRPITITLLSFLFFTSLLHGQDEPVFLNNPSFEDMARHSHQPIGWYDCGFPNESKPDTQPGSFDVTKPAKDGDTYLGMVVRDNDTWEMVGQRLSGPLQSGQCYEFSIYIARSELYLSGTKEDTIPKNHTTPAKLRIWGGSGYCSKAELLAESSMIINTRWLEYNFKFEPKRTHTYIVFEAFYRTPTLFPYNGNILLDNASPIIPVPCDVDTPTLADNTPKPKPEAKPTPPTPKPPKPAPTPTQPEPQKEKILADLDRTKIRQGQTIRIEKLYFPMDKSTFTEESFDVLTEIFDFLSSNNDVVVEIGGHTNTIPEHTYCDDLSTRRAKAVVDYLILKGIDRSRLEFKGYGKRQPIVRNDRYNMDARRKNQRVEIKILGFNG